MLEMKSTTKSIYFKPQKIEYGDALYFFFSFLNQTGSFIFIFTLIFRSSYVSFVYRLELKSRKHASEIFRSSYFSFVDILFLLAFSSEQVLA